MERVYFSINEAGAKTANDMMSFSEYKTGSKTAGYKAQVDKAYELAEKVIEARPTEEERVSKLCERYSRRLAQNINKDIQIGMMCPSVMISGAGNFPVKKKEKQVAAWDKNHEDYKEVEAILGKIEAIFYGKDVIKSDDENAIEKLQDKVDGLREDQERMKQANKAIRMKDKEKGDATLQDMGYTDEQIAQLSGNQNVQWVSRTGVQFTPEFKILAWEQKKQGRRMKDIFRDNGIDPDILGRKRIENFSVRLDDAVREGRFLPDRRIYNSRPAGAADPEQMPLEERVRWLIHELEYAKQEVEFLKKLQMANTEARKEWESKHRHG
mgnify:CR=1 FL=1